MRLPVAGAIAPGRVVDALECACSVLLAILFAHLLHASNVSWAAISGYMVMRGHVADSLLRGVLRIVGTVVGAALALLLVPVAVGSPVLCAIAAAAVGGVALYGAITGRRAYAWLFLGLTFEMVLLDQLEFPANAIDHFARTRVLEVCAGTIACLVVATLSALTVRRIWPGTRGAEARRLGWHPQAARHAAQGSAALALLPPLWHYLAVPQLAQSAVTVMAVMLVPITSVGVSGFAPVSRRLLQRVAGCSAGALFAAAFLFAAPGNAIVLIAGTVIGVIAGKLAETGRAAFSYIGLQFAIVILMTLVPDSYAQAGVDPAIERLVGIAVGMAILEPVLFLWHVVRPAERVAVAEPAPGAGGTSE